MPPSPLKALLVAADLETTALLEEALLEIEEVRYMRSWMQPWELVPAGDLAEALDALQAEQFDVILLDAALPEGFLPAFSRLRSCASALPVIILAEPEDEALAISLLRRGAQDYLIKSEIDCLPLARTLRAAVERQRLRNALESLALTDELTGTFTAGGFQALAARMRRLAKAAGLRVQLLLVELDGDPETQEIVLAAGTLQEMFDETGLVARVGPARFAVLVALEQPGAAAGSVRDRLRVALRVASWPLDAETPLEEALDWCRRRLCENKRCRPDTPPHVLSLDEDLTGIGVYCDQMIQGLPAAWPEARFLLCYRAHRFLAGWRRPAPPNCRRRLLVERAPWLAPDLFHGLNQRLPASRFRRAVATFHDLFVLTADYSTPEFRRRFARQALEAAARSDLIIAVSEFTASQVSDLLGVDRRRLRVVPHGVDLPPTLPAGRRLALVLHVGAIQKRKNLIRLVRAFRAMPPGWRLVLAGSSGFGAAQIFEEIERSPRRSDIEVTGYVPRQRLEQLYRQASILAFPSLDEGFGMPVLEAMAHGLPVITSNRSALPEVAGDAAILVDPLEEDEIASALRSLASNVELRERLAARGWNRAARFPWRTAVEKTGEVYKELLN